MAQEIKMSAAGLKAMQEELEYLKTVRRKELAEEIKEARSHGDLSENSEYDEAKNTQGLVENRITELEQTIKNAVIIDESELSVDNVSVGTHVTIRETGEAEAEEYDIVGRTEADAFNGYKAAEGNNVEILKTAIEAGYRYFDTASFYQTEEFVGQAIRESNLPREDFFLVSKMWKDEMGYQQTKDALEKSLKRLGTDYLDIYLIHWPRPSADCENWKELDLETWRAMEELQKEGKIRGLGLSNFLPHHIKNILENGTVKPVVNQLELHPGYMQQAAVQYCKEHGIQMQAWSPIGRRRILEDGLILELAGKYQVSPAQLCLRFLLQNDIIPLPKSSSMERMKQNMDLFHFEISEEDVSRLATMPQAGWSGEHPDPELAQKNVV